MSDKPKKIINDGKIPPNILIVNKVEKGKIPPKAPPPPKPINNK